MSVTLKLADEDAQAIADVLRNKAEEYEAKSGGSSIYTQSLRRMQGAFETAVKANKK